MGKSTTKANSQRKKLSVSGGMSSWTSRPTMALPAQSSGGTNKSAAVRGVKACGTKGICRELYLSVYNPSDICATDFMAGFKDLQIYLWSSTP
jgi:hypothetical protein